MLIKTRFAENTREKRMKKTKCKIYLTIWMFIIVLNLAAWCSTPFCDWYIAHVFPVWINTYGRFTALFPFSVGEIMIVLGFCLLAGGIILGTVWGMEVLIRRKVKQKRAGDISLRSMDMLTVSLAKQEKRANGIYTRKFENFCKGYFVFGGWILLAVALIMTLNCTILYHASSFSEKYFGSMEGYEKNKQYTVEELRTLRNFVVEKCNSLSQQMNRDEEGEILYDGDFVAEAKKAMKKLGETYNNLSGYYPSLKPLISSDFMSQQYMTGYYFPFSMEANYNNVMYFMNQPATFCHELAHLKGYIYEDEANFIAYLACLESEEAVIQYAGYLSVLNYIDNDFYASIGKDRERYQAEVSILSQVHDDNVFLTSEEWQRIEEKAVLDTETVDAISDKFTDTTLRLNGVSDGMASYGRVVRLLLEYYNIYGYP